MEWMETPDRFYENIAVGMKDYAEKQSIAFAEWVCSVRVESDKRVLRYDYGEEGKWWDSQEDTITTTKQLYELFLEQINQ